MMDPGLREQFEARLREIEIEHRDLDMAIARLANDLFHDELSIKRMKRRKLLLKDQIASIKRQLDPDILA